MWENSKVHFILAHKNWHQAKSTNRVVGSGVANSLIQEKVVKLANLITNTCNDNSKINGLTRLNARLTTDAMAANATLSSAIVDITVLNT